MTKNNTLRKLEIQNHLERIQYLIKNNRPGQRLSDGERKNLIKRAQDLQEELDHLTDQPKTTYSL